MATLSGFRCPDCDGMIFPKVVGITTTGKLCMIGVCTTCVKHEGKISVTVTLPLDLKEIVNAKLAGFPVFQIGSR